MECIVEQEELIKKYIEEDNRQAAVKLLFEMITVCAKEKNFTAAETLRERIFEIDPLALTEIIRSGEIIEEEKNESIDRNHRETWAKLYNTLTLEEANAFYFSQKTAVFEPNAEVFAQGEWKPRLFFINRGQLKLIYRMGSREVLLKIVNPGRIVGEEAFFSSSFCTTTMTAISQVHLSYLEADILKDWKISFPVLESKLQDFASKSESVRDLLRTKDLDRRSLKRVPISGKSYVNLMSPAGNPVGKPFKVDLCDISQGGICFLVRIAKKEAASLLLGQRIGIECLHSRVDFSEKIKKNGIIVAVRFHPFEDCTVNVRFDTLLPERTIDDFQRMGATFSHELDNWLG